MISLTLLPLPLHDHLKHLASNVTKFMCANQNFLTNNFFLSLNCVRRSRVLHGIWRFWPPALLWKTNGTLRSCARNWQYIFAHWGVKQNLRFDKHFRYAKNSMQTLLLEPNRLEFIAKILIFNPSHSSTTGWFLSHALSLIVSVLFYAQCEACSDRQENAQNAETQRLKNINLKFRRMHAATVVCSVRISYQQKAHNTRPNVVVPADRYVLSHSFIGARS